MRTVQQEQRYLINIKSTVKIYFQDITMDKPKEDSRQSIIPDFTLRKKYHKRPANVIKIRLKKVEKNLKLPQDTVQRLWILTDRVLVVVKTWHFSALPRINDVFDGFEIENITIEFNVGPHEDDVKTLEDISLLKSSTFCLEFREHWAGLSPKISNASLTEALKERKEEDKKYEIKMSTNTGYSDKFIAPFMKRTHISTKITVITGRLSTLFMQNICTCKNLQFLGLRVNFEEYKVLVDCIEEYRSLERLHILPQWKHDPKSVLPPIR